MLIQADRLRLFCTDILSAAGMPHEEAVLVSDVMVDADLSGVSGHGVRRLPSYMERIQSGGNSAALSLSVIRDWPGGAVLDAGSSFGQTAAASAMDMAMRKASEHGNAVVTIRNMSHTGANSYFVRRAAHRGYIAVMSGNGPAMVAPYGGKRPFFSTSPFSAAFPCAPGTGDYADETEIDIDMATSVSSRGKILQNLAEGRKIPEGWAINSEGFPTTEPSEALRGALLPFGAHKGYALEIFIEVITALLAGASIGPELSDHLHNASKPIGSSDFFLVINPERFVGLDSFRRRMRTLVDMLRSAEPAPGFEKVYVPGELQYLSRRRALAEGITLSSETADALARLSQEYGVSL